MDAAFKRLTVMKKKGKDPALYDGVAIGTPVWATKMSSPVRIYLLRKKDRLKKVAFFLTGDGLETKRCSWT